MHISRNIGAMIGFTLFNAGPALALEPAMQVLRDAYDVPANTHPVTRFDVGKDREAFILDQRRLGQVRQQQLLFRYVRSREVFVLRRVPGPRGDMMLKNDLGAVMVRISRVGGPILFPERDSHGVPAWRSGPAEPLKPRELRLKDLRPALSNIARDLADTLDHDVTISARGANEQSAWLYLDAAMNARTAINRLARGPDRKGRTLPALNKVKLVAGEKQGLVLNNDVLEIHLVPGDGFAGRPSSLRLAGFLSAKRVRADKD